MIASLLWKILTFLIFAFVLYYFLKKPIASFINQRIKKIMDELENLRKEKYDLTNRFEQTKSKMDNLNLEIEKINASFQKQLEEEKQKLHDETNQLLEKLKIYEKNNIDAEVKKYNIIFLEKILNLTINKAKEDIKNTLDENKQKQLYKKYVSKVESIERQ